VDVNTPNSRAYHPAPFQRELPQMFRYPWTATIKVDIPTGLLIALASVIAFYGFARGDTAGGILFVGLVLFFSSVVVLCRIASSSIRISETHIAAYVFGLCWRSIGWDEVSKIKSSANSKRTQESITFDITLRDQKANGSS
jgi:hypothetical protein